MLALLKAIWRITLDTFFPIFCIGCGSEGTYVCGECFKAMPRQQKQVCPVCYKDSAAGRVVPANGDVCDACKTAYPDFALDGLVCVGEYEENSLMARLIHNYKYEFIEDLAEPLAEILKERAGVSFGAGADETATFDEFGPLAPASPFDAVTFVPLHPKRQHWRGFNQSQKLAEIVADELQLPCLDLLNRLTFSKPQMELGRAERLLNIKNAFAATFVHVNKKSLHVQTFGKYNKVYKLSNRRQQESTPMLPPEKVLLIDDVATTLSTLEECASALKKAGVKKVFALVLARVY